MVIDVPGIFSSEGLGPQDLVRRAEIGRIGLPWCDLMTSALRTRAMTETAPAGPGEARMEPVFSTAGGSPPLVTDIVHVGGGVGGARRLIQSALGWLALGSGVMRRINPVAMALVVMGMGLAVFAMGLILYFWPQSPTLPASVPVATVGAEPGTPRVPLPALPVAASPSQNQVKKPVISATLAEMPVMPVAVNAATAENVELAQHPVVGAADPVPDPTHADASTPAPLLTVETALAQTSPAMADAKADVGFGSDANANQVPDTLDRWLSATLHSPEIQEAGRQYYRTVLPLATKLNLGIALSNAEKLNALRAAECYLLTATEGGLPVPPNLNNQVLMQGGDAAERMKGLFKTLQGVEFVVSANRGKACG